MLLTLVEQDYGHEPYLGLFSDKPLHQILTLLALHVYDLDTSLLQVLLAS